MFHYVTIVCTLQRCNRMDAIDDNRIYGHSENNALEEDEATFLLWKQHKNNPFRGVKSSVEPWMKPSLSNTRLDCTPL